MEKEFFDQAFAKAAYLMNSDEFNQKVGLYENKNKGGSSVTNDFSHFEKAAFGESAVPQTQGPDLAQLEAMAFNTPLPAAKKESKLPQAILNSFRNTPSPVSETTINEGQSASERMVKIMPEKIVAPQPTINTGIDYGVIKALIDESISRHLNEIKNQILNESTTLKGFKLTEGNKVQFLDTKGNLYEGTLTLKKKKEVKK